MVKKPAPLDVVRQKLDARSEEVRLVALLHAAAHGGAARGLAARVAAMLEDESAAVQWHAVGTFRSIGEGATDAVPVLLDLLAKGGPPMLVARATRCLGYVGPAARDAVPVLKTALRQDSIDANARGGVLEALWSIAAEDEGVLNTVVADALSLAFSRYLGVSRLFERASEPLTDRIFAEIAARTRGVEPGGREAAARLLASIGSGRPEATAPLLGELLSDPAAPEAFHAASALRHLPAPKPPALVDAVIRVAAGEGIAALRALEVLAELGPEASRAQETLLEVIARNVGADPVPGPPGWPASSLADAANALARVCPTDRAVEPLLTWLRRVTATAGSAHDERSWYPIRRVVVALAALAPHSEAVHEAILAAVATAQTSIDDDESGVLDFHRSVRGAFERLPNAEVMFAKAEKLGMPRIDPYEEEDEPEQTDSSLPDFPVDEEPEPAATLAPLDEGDRAEVAASIVRGRSVLGLPDEPEPQAVAAAVERWLGRLKRQGAEATDADRTAVAVAYGDAVARATGWQWTLYSWRGTRHLALASADATYVHLPVAFISGQIASGTETTALLLFNMLASGEWPQAQPGRLSMIR